MKPPLDLTVEVLDAHGVQYRWTPAARDARNQPLDLGFSTKRGDGFSTGTARLPRRGDRDDPDLNLLDDVTFVGVDGTIAYEGRVGAMPRSFDAGHSVAVQLAGWMAHARDRPIAPIYIDRDLSAWGQPARALRAALLAGNFNQGTFEVAPDVSNGLPGLVEKIDGAWASPAKPIVDAVYDAGPIGRVGKVYYDFAPNANVVVADNNWQWYVQTSSTDDQSSGTLDTGNLRAASGSGYFEPSAPGRYAFLHWYYAATPAGTAGVSYELTWRNLAVYGDHDLPLYGGHPQGVLASDVIRHAAGAACPKLNTSGVQATTTPIPHLAFKDLTDPYDIFLAVNAYHLWELAVWENKTLHYYPSDRTAYDWQVTTTEPGVTVELQGDTTEDLASGIIVEYDNVNTGARDILMPDAYADLRDLSPENPANAHGIPKWPRIQLSHPTSADAALQIGRAALNEYNAPKQPGTIRVKGHIRDGAKHWQQGWRPRAGETIAILDHPNDTPRLIAETSWDHDAKTLTVTLDAPPKRLDAVLDRMGTALAAANLS